ncbi:hypothetical protein [Longimicrobium sp.]|jgi:hypothetical protein|uniref:hypothetical protein n=1 Tax=Longimicrobium sp. TaxID=2029185 RepID=UPI002ED78DF6
MLNVYVPTSDHYGGLKVPHPTAASWDVTGDGNLVLYGGDGTAVAEYARTEWKSVAKPEDEAAS